MSVNVCVTLSPDPTHVVDTRPRSCPLARRAPLGSCLFHSMAYGIGGVSASSLRPQIGAFIAKNPNLEIAETPLKDWVSEREKAAHAYR